MRGLKFSLTLVVWGAWVQVDSVGIALAQSEAIREDEAAWRHVETLTDVVLQRDEERKIHCKVAGLVATSELSEGMRVTLGQPLLKQEAAKAELQLQRLLAEKSIIEKQASSTVELEFGQKSIAVADADLERVLESNRKYPGLYPEAEVNRLGLLVERARAELAKNAFQLEVLELQAAAKQWEIETAKVEIEDRVIRAPMSGMIVEVLRRPGEWVDATEPVARIVRLDQLRLEVDVPVVYSREQLAAAEAHFVLDSLSGESLSAQARIKFVDPEVNPITRTSRVWFLVDNTEERLRPGLPGRLELKFESPRE